MPWPAQSLSSMHALKGTLALGLAASFTWLRLGISAAARARRPASTANLTAADMVALVRMVRMTEMTEWVRLCSFRGVAWLCRAGWRLVGRPRPRLGTVEASKPLQHQLVPVVLKDKLGSFYAANLPNCSH